MAGSGIDPPNRGSDRVPIAAEVDLEFESFQGFLSEYSANISLGGMFVRCAQPPPVGTVLRFSLKLKGDFKLIQGRGEVVWNREQGQGADKPAGVGIRFLELPPASQDLIRRMVDRYRVQGGQPFDLGGSSAKAEPLEAAVPDPLPVQGLRDDIFIPPDLPPPSPQTAPPQPGAAGFREAAPPGVAARRGAGLPPRRRYVRPGTVVLVIGAALAGGLVAQFGERLVHWATGYDRALAERVVNDIPPPVSLASEPAAAPAAEGTASSALTPAEAGVTDLGPGPATETATAASEPAVGSTGAEELAIVLEEGYASATEALNRIRLITWKEAAEGAGTVVTLWGNGSLRRQDLVRVRLGGATARELVKLRGIDWPFRDPTLEIDSSQVRRIRTGFHPKDLANELHVVVDLRDSASRLRRVTLGERSVQLLFN